MHLSWLDILALLVIAVSVLTAFIKGLARELISLASVVAGLVLAFLFYPRAAEWVGELGLDSNSAAFFGFLGIFVGVIISGLILSFLADRLLKTLYVKWIDRLLGAAFGLIRGCLIVSVVFLALTAFPVHRELLLNSSAAEYFVTAARVLITFAPPHLSTQFQNGYGWLYQRWLERSLEDHEISRH